MFTIITTENAGFPRPLLFAVVTLFYYYGFGEQEATSPCGIKWVGGKRERECMHLRYHLNLDIRSHYLQDQDQYHHPILHACLLGLGRIWIKWHAPWSDAMWTTLLFVCRVKRIKVNKQQVKRRRINSAVRRDNNT